MRADRLPPAFASRSRGVQAVLALALPIVFGAICGVVLGLSAVVYLVLSLLALLGGLGAGLEHHGARGGALRGVVGGALFGAALLVAHAVSGAQPKAHLPEPAVLLVLITTVIGAAAGALGAALAGRSRAT